MTPRDILAMHAYQQAWSSDVPQEPFENANTQVIRALLEDADAQIAALVAAGFSIIRTIEAKP